MERNRFASAESVARPVASDRNGAGRRYAYEIKAKLWQRAMQGVQGGVAVAPIALHPQQD
jgi:hypothetical protein